MAEFWEDPDLVECLGRDIASRLDAAVGEAVVDYVSKAEIFISADADGGYKVHFCDEGIGGVFERCISLREIVVEQISSIGEDGNDNDEEAAAEVESLLKLLEFLHSRLKPKAA